MSVEDRERTTRFIVIAFAYAALFLATVFASILWRIV